ncbi:hypothetical protein V6N13_009026 [Hibiscus sabdariffa]|uniref:Uncharacterized protein n=1 Tax=Hibiscus sabdariffa TaxID=183260 RepID=A0ABR2ADX8_9ROSI
MNKSANPHLDFQSHVSNEDEMHVSNAYSGDIVVPSSVLATPLSPYKGGQKSHKVDFHVVEFSLDSVIGLSNEQMGLVDHEMEDGQRVSPLAECEIETNIATPIRKNMHGPTNLKTR